MEEKCIFCDGSGKYKSKHPEVKVTGVCQACGGSGKRLESNIVIEEVSYDRR